MTQAQKDYPTLTDIGQVHAAVVKLLIPVSLEQVYQCIVEQAVVLAKAEHGTIFFYDEPTTSFKRAFTTVPSQQQFTPREGGNTWWVYHHNRPKFVSREELLAAHPDVMEQVHSVILIPLSFQKIKLGVLSLQSNLTTPFEKKHHESLLLFGNIASLAIRKAQLHKQNQQALETRDLFMSAASHEFKTPLSSIRAYAQLAQQKIKSGKAVTDKTVSAIIRNADRLTEMINSLFMASQVSAGTFTPRKENFDLSQVTHQCLDDLQVASQRKLTTSLPAQKIEFFGDKNQWCSVVMNLVRNAINYSPVGSPVSIALEATSDTAIFTVSNEGKGIPKDDLEHIFEKYFRAKQQKAGLGLGLFLCHQIVKAHHGKISITSQPHKLTTVTVELPLHHG